MMTLLLIMVSIILTEILSWKSLEWIIATAMRNLPMDKTIHFTK